MVRPIASLLTLLALTVAATGCGSDAATPTSPTDPVATVEVFSDATLNRNGARVHPFAVQAPGTVTATLTTLEPDATVLIGMGLGTWNGVACNITIANDSDFGLSGAVFSADVGKAYEIALQLRTRAMMRPLREAVKKGMTKDEIIKNVKFEKYKDVRNYYRMNLFINSYHHFLTTGKPEVAMP